MSNIFDVMFPASASRPDPANGYETMSAVARWVPALHDHPLVGIHPLRGTRVGRGHLRLEAGVSNLIIRTPAELLPELVVLAGKRLTIGDAPVRLGCPRVLPLRPSPVLASRVVTIKGFMEPEPFRMALTRQFDALNPSRTPEVVVGPRRVVRIKGKTIVGFSVWLDGLADADSLVVQADGLGGRRRFGCGVFVPAPEAIAAAKGGTYGGASQAD